MDGVIGRDWLGGDLVGTAVLNALSLAFPEGERLFMDAVREYRHQLPGALAAQVQAVIAQESIHTREHIALNSLLDRSHYPVDQIEAEIRARIDDLRRRGSMAMLSVTIALEHFTAMMADVFLTDNGLLEGAPLQVKRLWQWHSLEETEHKAVAFDVFLDATAEWTPRQRHRMRAHTMRLVSFQFFAGLARHAVMLLRADGMGPVRAYVRVLWWMFGRPGLLRRCWPAYADWYRSDFHPWNHDNRALLERWRPVFDRTAARKA